MRHSEHELRNAAEKWLSATGSNAYEAKVVADHLVNANLRGHDSHGVGMIAIYRDFIQDGRLKPNTAPRLLNDRGSILQFAGDRGYGQRIGHDATEQAIARAKETGLCLYTIANTCHLGRIGTYGEQCADAGMVSLHFVNVQHFQPLVAPWGGSDARFGTNPFCCAIPATEKNGRFILDFATSIVAMGKTRVAYLAKKRFPQPVMLDAKGQPTDDPKVMWEDPKGSLMPMGLYKGAGLCFACELLAGLLSTGGTNAPSLLERDGTIVNNMTSIVIDPKALCDLTWMKREMDAMIEYVKASPEPDPKGNPILEPGDVERERTAERTANGVGISDGEWAKILETCALAGVTEADIRA